jgi:glycosyltransferase involved in cell wall biosynthesis
MQNLNSGPHGIDEDSEVVRPSHVLLSIVVPVFNEREAVPLFDTAVRKAVSSEKDLELEFVFVNDGSQDGTLRALLELRNICQDVVIVDLSRNFGKEAALTAGLEHCSGDIVVPMDVDLQDPPELLPKLIEQWRRGFDVVLARRTSRQSDSFLKRWCAAAFYRVHNLVSELDLVENVGDFRLLDRKVLEALKRLPESRRFMKGLFAWVGFHHAIVSYERQKRSAGNSKFNGWRLWNLALEGVTSFTTVPLRVWTYLGFFTAFLSFAYGTYLALRVMVRGIDVPGYASVFVAVVFLGGLQLLGIGILGEYLGRTYLESKGRPVYIASKIYGARHRPDINSARQPETL